MKELECKVVKLEQEVLELKESIKELKKNIAQEVLSLLENSICKASKSCL